MTHTINDNFKTLLKLVFDQYEYVYVTKTFKKFVH